MIFEKHLNPVWLVLIEKLSLSTLMSTHLPGFQSFFDFFAPFSIGQINHQRHKHGLSQQGVWVPFRTPEPLKRTPKDTQKYLCGISKNLNLKLIIEFFPMTLFNDIIPYFDEFIHVYGWNMSILWSPLKI